MKKVRILTTKSERVALSKLRIALAEIGYYIFPVAPWYRRHRLDFVAIPKLSPTQLVVVRPMRDKSISVRPFSASFGDIYPTLADVSICTGVSIHHDKRQLPYAKARPDAWNWFLSKKSRIEHEKLIANNAR